MPEPVCDFCSGGPVRWSYPCRDFQHRAVDFTFNSAGGWAACDTCHSLIERHDRQGLAVRCASGHPERRYVPIAALTKRVRSLHDTFWANREGPAVAVTGDFDPTA